MYWLLADSKCIILRIQKGERTLVVENWPVGIFLPKYIMLPNRSMLNCDFRTVIIIQTTRWRFTSITSNLSSLWKGQHFLLAIKHPLRWPKWSWCCSSRSDTPESIRSCLLCSVSSTLRNWQCFHWSHFLSTHLLKRRHRLFNSHHIWTINLL